MMPPVPFGPRPQAAWWVALLGLTAILGSGVMSRLTLLGRGAHDYDEGVYWQSLDALRGGHRLFGEVFSSQPPLFLLQLEPAYAAAGGGIALARGEMLAAWVVAVLAVFWAGHELAGTAAGLFAAALLAFDPLAVHASVTLQAEMPAIAWGVVAVAFAASARRRGGAWLELAAGGALAAGVLTKLLDVAVALPVALLLATPDRRWRGPAFAMLGATVLSGAVLALYLRDLRPAYAQVLALHLSGGPLRLGVGPRGLLAAYLEPEHPGIPALALAVAATAGAVFGRRRNTWWLGAWLLGALAVVALHRPAFSHHVVLLAPPLALLGGTGIAALAEGRRRAATVGAFGVAAALVAGLAGVSAASLRRADDPQTARVAGYLQGLRAGGTVVTDDQFAAAVAGVPVPPGLVDTSMVRVRSGNLTALQVEVYAPDLVVMSTGRLEAVPGLVAWLERGYVLDRGIDAPGVRAWRRTASAPRG